MGQLEAIRAYWNLRAEGYSAHNLDELEDAQRIRWINTIMRYAPEGARLKVLDIGCGPGFFSILMSMAGHEVTGIDYADEMIAHAKENAGRMYQNITFQRMDAQHLDFADESFDLVISRNCMWCLEDPKQAYREWLRVLHHGGRIVNFDGNFYLDRFDAGFHDATIEQVRAAEEIHEKYIGNVDVDVINRIAMDLPLSKVKRPSWDFETLSSLGAHRFDVELFDHVLVKTKETEAFYARTFVVSAEK